MKTNKVIENIVVELTRFIHPKDLGSKTSKLENKLRETLTTIKEQMLEAVGEEDTDPNNYGRPETEGYNIAKAEIKQAIINKYGE